jgi:Glycosyl transferases group 1
MKRLKILTWHTHGSYLYYLTQAPHDFYVLSKSGRPPGYGGRCGNMPWGDNVFDLPVEEAYKTAFDCIVFQDDVQYLEDQYLYLAPAQRNLPRIYIEHDPPRDHPTDSRHPVRDRGILLVHVTPFNQLMWDNASIPNRVIEHGVMVPEEVSYSGALERGLVVVNHLAQRGRRLGADIFLSVREQVPLDLVGMDSTSLGGLGEVQHARLSAFACRYRFFFNPIRYTSMGLAVIEAMASGVPVVGLATTEMATAIENGVSGYVDTDVSRLTLQMKRLLDDPDLARHLGCGARRRAQERFHIQRFIEDWNSAFKLVCM